MIITDKYACASPAAAFEPGGKICFAVCPLVICIVFRSAAVSLVVFAVMTFAAVKWGGTPPGILMKFLTMPSAFLLAGAAVVTINAYPAGTPVLWGISAGSFVYGVTKASLWVGLNLTLSAFAAVSCMYFLSFTTPVSELFRSFRKAGVPPIIVSLAELIYRYIFLIWEEASKVSTAQKCRLGYYCFISRVSCAGELAANLFVRAYSRSERAYAALESRGYSGSFDTVDIKRAPCRNLYVWSVVFSAVLIAAGAFCRG